MVDITTEKAINTSLIYYDRTKNEGDSTDKVNTPIISHLQEIRLLVFIV